MLTPMPLWAVQGKGFSSCLCCGYFVAPRLVPTGPHPLYCDKFLFSLLLSAALCLSQDVLAYCSAWHISLIVF